MIYPIKINISSRDGKTPQRKRTNDHRYRSLLRLMSIIYSIYCSSSIQNFKTMIPIVQSQKTSGSSPLLSPEFIALLKKELGQKVKPSKSVLQALKHSNQANQQYKREIQELKSQIVLLTKQPIEEPQHPSTPSTAETKKIRAQRFKSLCLKSTVALSINPLSNQQLPSILEAEVLRQKIAHLQGLLETKQRRCDQMVDREAILTGQIDILRLKNQTLTQRIESLEEQLQKITQIKTRQFKTSTLSHLPEQIVIRAPHEPTKVSQRPALQQIPEDQDTLGCHGNFKHKESRFKEGEGKTYEHRNSWFKEETASKIDFEGQQLTRYINQGRNKSILGLSCLDIDASMMASCTKMIEIEQQYDIQRKATIVLPINNEQDAQFNEIDAILQEEVSKTSTNSLPEEQTVYENINSSFINIRVYDEGQKSPIETILI